MQSRTPNVAWLVQKKKCNCSLPCSWRSPFIKVAQDQFLYLHNIFDSLQALPQMNPPKFYFSLKAGNSGWVLQHKYLWQEIRDGRKTFQDEGNHVQMPNGMKKHGMFEKGWVAQSEEYAEGNGAKKVGHGRLLNYIIDLMFCKITLKEAKRINWKGKKRL